eukprot:Skav229540  [mRNA]  locus=scaffold568:172428:173821:+ [translate_table: standard]
MLLASKALSPECVVSADRARFFGCPEKVRIFHYSSDPKPWARLLDPFYATFSEEALHHCKICRESDAIDREGDRSGVASASSDGKLFKALGWEKRLNGKVMDQADQADQPDEEDLSAEVTWHRVLGDEVCIPESAVQGAEQARVTPFLQSYAVLAMPQVVRKSLQLWEEAQGVLKNSCYKMRHRKNDDKKRKGIIRNHVTRYEVLKSVSKIRQEMRGRSTDGTVHSEREPGRDV